MSKLIFNLAGRIGSNLGLPYQIATQFSRSGTRLRACFRNLRQFFHQRNAERIMAALLMPIDADAECRSG
jgi:hypothetical protein